MEEEENNQTSNKEESGGYSKYGITDLPKTSIATSWGQVCKRNDRTNQIWSAKIVDSTPRLFSTFRRSWCVYQVILWNQFKSVHQWQC